MPKRWTRDVQLEWLLVELQRFQKMQKNKESGAGTDTFVAGVLERWFKRFPENIELYGIEGILTVPLPHDRPTPEEAASMLDPENSPGGKNPNIPEDRLKAITAARDAQGIRLRSWFNNHRHKDTSVSQADAPISTGPSGRRKKSKSKVSSDTGLAPVGAAIPVTRIVAPRAEDIYMARYPDQWKPRYQELWKAELALAKLENRTIYPVSVKRRAVSECWREEKDAEILKSILDDVAFGHKEVEKRRHERSEEQKEAKRAAKEQSTVVSVRTPEEYQTSISVLGRGLQHWTDRTVHDTGGLMLSIWTGPIPNEGGTIRTLVAYGGATDGSNMTYMEWRGESEPGDFRGFMEGVVNPFGRFARRVFTREVRTARSLAGGISGDVAVENASRTIIQQVTVQEEDEGASIGDGAVTQAGNAGDKEREAGADGSERDGEQMAAVNGHERDGEQMAAVNGQSANMEVDINSNQSSPATSDSTPTSNDALTDENSASATKLSSTATVTTTTPSNSPIEKTLWFVPYQEALAKQKYGEEWSKLVATWAELERVQVEGKAPSTNVASKIPSQDIPDVIAKWVAEGMPVNDVPTYVQGSETRAFVAQCKAWWTVWEPKGWQDGMDKVDKEELKFVRQSGQNGMVVLMVMLWWWRSKVTAGGVKPWKAVVNDLLQVLIGVSKLAANEGSAAARSTKKLRKRKILNEDTSAATPVPTKRIGDLGESRVEELYSRDVYFVVPYVFT
ncbi:hypothetical protein M422DRAFT_267160 [Sphaerobolus stellatus SS14]|uniref:Uncharacterized protein n=1 Tax=Sphaerobolus stellatus (strain SS14) TaxID=990650 RepID=A0A0C9UQ72_SPHS4|nr:hypothetical protein M422DRAFT_267160 [Sphaerobolus stellatus SS14]